MRPLGRLMRRLRLVTGMARAMGVDLAAAHRDGRLEQQDWARMVHSCRHCRWSGACESWLNDPARRPGAEAPPAECRNRVRLAALKAEQQVLENR